MSEETKPRRKSGLINMILGKINMLLAAIAVSLIFSIILEWIGIAFWWPEEGHLHSQTMMLNEMQWLSDDFSQSLFAKSSTAFATSIIENVYNWLFVYTGIKEWLTSPGNGSMEQWVHHYGRAYIESIIYVMITFIIRLIIIVFTSPLFLLTALSGLTEGLSLRIYGNLVPDGNLPTYTITLDVILCNDGHSLGSLFIYPVFNSPERYFSPGGLFIWFIHLYNCGEFQEILVNFISPWQYAGVYSSVIVSVSSFSASVSQSELSQSSTSQ
ncbi:integrating conjugative element membrane protein, PFL_4697 family [Mannheimia haemolytica]|uniref:Integrating conjugative element membrane protein, PFL_4697 family n=1 Tax=Mannheimia haemolytica TaxID=75985 RepID=A0A378N8M5_MANHA|nr:integrating conjugative element membrane protein, PFL_4697 family [Mannheimia haemolytica]